jgi:hypothetical protein
MTKRNNLVFIGLHIIAWIIFVGFCIEAGALITNFIFSLFKPEVVHNLYEKLDLSQIYNESKWKYFGTYSFILTISILKAYLFYILIMLLMKLDLSNPFSRFVASHITKISYLTLSIGLISYIGQQTVGHYGFETDSLNRFWADAKAYIFMAAVIKVIASIFSRGVELQEENDLTV